MTFTKIENGAPGWQIDPRALKPEAYDDETAAVEEITRIAIENRKGAEWERISPYILRFNRDGEPDFAYEKESVLGMAEYEGMKNMRELAKNGNRYLIWISPPYGRSGYTEGRVVVGVVKKHEEEVEIECRGVPLLADRQRIGEMAKRWQEVGFEPMDEIGEVEDLREQALGGNLGNDADFWEWCEVVFGMEKVWEMVQTGEDLKMKKEVEIAVREEWRGVVARGMRLVSTREESVYWGRQIEMGLKRRGLEMVGGNHGGLNSAVGGGIRSAFGELYARVPSIGEKSDKLKECPKCHNFYMKKKGKCPACGGE